MKPTPRHQSLHEVLQNALAAHVDIPAVELLAIAAHFTGGIIAMIPIVTPQDAQAMSAILSENMKAGSQQMMLAVADVGGSA